MPKEKEDEEKSGIEQTPEPLKQILIQRQVRRLVPFSEVEKYGRVCLTPHLTINSEGFKLEFKIGIPGDRPCSPDRKEKYSNSI